MDFGAPHVARVGIWTDLTSIRSKEKETMVVLDRIVLSRRVLGEWGDGGWGWGM